MYFYKTFLYSISVIVIRAAKHENKLNKKVLKKGARARHTHNNMTII